MSRIATPRNGEELHFQREGETFFPMVMREHLWIPVILTNGCILTVVEVIPLQAEYAVAPFGSPLPLLRFFPGDTIMTLAHVLSKGGKVYFREPVLQEKRSFRWLCGNICGYRSF
jgi:hypothetical protein